jgi:propanol-preferring alcohol dehydrogenase
MLRTVSNLTRADARAFLDVAAEAAVRVETEVAPLDAVNDILLRMKRRALRAAAVVRPTGEDRLWRDGAERVSPST